MTDPEAHLILLPGGRNPMYECSICSQLFLFEPPTTTVTVADEFIVHLATIHDRRYHSRRGVKVIPARASDAA